MVSRLRIEVPSDGADLAAVVSAADVFVRARGVDDTGVHRVADVLAKLTQWATARAYPDGAVGPITVELQPVEGGLEVLVLDRGDPAPDFGGAAGPVPPELRPLADLTRGLRQVNLADLGTRISAVITVPGMRQSAPRRTPAIRVRPVRVTPGEVEIRDGVPADAAAIVDLLFAAYGLAYAHPDFYRPEWIADQMRAGRVLSTVAVFRGEVIAHHALLAAEAGAAVESAVVVVHPAFRGLGIVSNHLEAVLKRAVQAEAPAVLTQSVTHHPYSQMAEQALGFRTTALMLGAAAYDDHPRSALTMAYLVLENRPHSVCLPGAYADAVGAAYANAGVEIEPPVEPGTGVTPHDGDFTRGPEHGGPQVTTARTGPQVMPGSEVITVSGWDERARARLSRVLRSAVRSDVEVVHADVNLQSLSAAQIDDAVALLRAHDFFYCGLVLFGHRGHDHLRLQALLTDNVQVQGLVLEGDYSQHLYDAILADAGPRLRTT